MKRSIKDVLKRSGRSDIDETMDGASHKKAKHWSQGLKLALADVTLRVLDAQNVIIIKDKYPKAKFHFLVLPKLEIKDLLSLEKVHLPILKEMQEEAIKQVERVKEQNPGYNFSIGYHAVPSMSPLHLHVISQDFNSPCLKTKKHWNSFTSEFFRLSQDVIKELETSGKLTMQTYDSTWLNDYNLDIDKDYYESVLKRDLRCHVCEESCSTMPKLKEHIQKHEAAVNK